MRFLEEWYADEEYIGNARLTLRGKVLKDLVLLILAGPAFIAAVWLCWIVLNLLVEVKL